MTPRKNGSRRATRILRSSSGGLGKQYTAKTLYGGAQQHFQGKTFPKYTKKGVLDKSIYTPHGGTKRPSGQYAIGSSSRGIRTLSGRVRAGPSNIVAHLGLKRKRTASRKRARGSLSERYG